jgi:cellulose synthase/poly-beta-1,6-N-acetylglucosamine synthase-like glycosyltransferase
MTDWVSWLLLSLALLLSIPSAVFAAQCLRAARPRRSHPLESMQTEASVTVLVPAHNEADGIGRTVQSVLPQLQPGDRLLVVADNCSDHTAQVARGLGAEVIERQHASLRGKGFALDHGVKHLSEAPTDLVLMIDADCVLHPGGLGILKQQGAFLQRPVQCCDLMQAPDGASLKTKVAAFAWLVKNKVRPLGSAGLGWPCQLMGTGMIFPWAVIRNAPLASGHLAEDMQLGASLAMQGMWPMYCDHALVTSSFPMSDAAQSAQRTRWEHGHLATIASQGPGLLTEALRQRSWKLLGMALDMCVPPLTSLVLMLCVLAALASINVLWHPSTVAMLVLCMTSLSLVAVLTAVLVSWWVYGRETLSSAELRSIPAYVFSKVPVYAGFITRRQTHWIRTKRDHESR